MTIAIILSVYFTMTLAVLVVAVTMCKIKIPNKWRKDSEEIGVMLFFAALLWPLTIVAALLIGTFLLIQNFVNKLSDKLTEAFGGPQG